MIDLSGVIVAPATGVGESAIAIVRLSGPGAIGLCDRFVRISAVGSV